MNKHAWQILRIEWIILHVMLQRMEECLEVVKSMTQTENSPLVLHVQSYRNIFRKLVYCDFWLITVTVWWLGPFTQVQVAEPGGGRVLQRSHSRDGRRQPGAPAEVWGEHTEGGRLGLWICNIQWKCKWVFFVTLTSAKCVPLSSLLSPW